MNKPRCLQYKLHVLFAVDRNDTSVLRRFQQRKKKKKNRTGARYCAVPPRGHHLGVEGPRMRSVTLLWSPPLLAADQRASLPSVTYINYNFIIIRVPVCIEEGYSIAEQHSGSKSPGQNRFSHFAGKIYQGGHQRKYLSGALDRGFVSMVEFGPRGGEGGGKQSSPDLEHKTMSFLAQQQQAVTLKGEVSRCN